jgi:pimeloyl-ACP methyl ester carboxylesterase
MLYYRALNSGAPRPWVVFLHGAGGGISSWGWQVAAFTDQFRVLLIDLRDHGQSKDIQPPYDRYTFDIICSDIKSVLDRERIDQAFFVTLSFGSVLLQALSLRYPTLVTKAVIAGGIFKGTRAIVGFTNLARFFNLFLPYPTMYRLFSYLLMPRAHHQRARRAYQLQAKKLSQAEYLKWVALYAEFFALLKKFYQAPLPYPALIVMGAEDYIFLPGARTFVAKHANSILEVLPGAGHICNIDQPDQFNALAINYLLAPSGDSPAHAPRGRV